MTCNTAHIISRISDTDSFAMFGDVGSMMQGMEPRNYLLRDYCVTNMCKFIKYVIIKAMF